MGQGIVKKVGHWIYSKNYKLYTKLIRIYLTIKDYEGREHIIHPGKLNEDKVFYVIRKKKNIGEGILSVFIYIMGRIDYAERNNMIPYVDMEPEIFSQFFKLNNGGVTYDEVFRSRYVLLSGWNSKPVYPGWCDWINLEHNELKKQLLEKYIEYTEELTDLVNEQRKIVNPERCVGLYLRGTDYIALKPSGHPVQPDFWDVKPYVDEFLLSSDCDYVFLVTEDSNIVSTVRNEYGDKLRVVSGDRYWGEYDGKSIIGKTVQQYDDKKANDMLYIAKIILLSECHSFVGGRTNGSSVACGMNGGCYKQKYVFDKGLYP